MSGNDLFFLLVTILFGALISGTPLLFATIGEIFFYRAGVMNLGIEGMMLVGAMSAFAVWLFPSTRIEGKTKTKKINNQTIVLCFIYSASRCKGKWKESTWTIPHDQLRKT